jgi:hypothetical protein
MDSFTMVIEYHRHTIGKWSTSTEKLLSYLFRYSSFKQDKLYRYEFILIKFIGTGGPCFYTFESYCDSI